MSARVYSHHGLDSDPLADGHSHDAFSVYTKLYHGGDVNKAIAAVAKMKKEQEVADPVPDSGFVYSPFEPGNAMSKRANDVVWVVQSLMDKGRVLSICGNTGCGKTAISTNLALSMATGTPFNGLGVVESRVLYCSGEAPDDVYRRFLAGAKFLNLDAKLLRKNLRATMGSFSIDNEAALETVAKQALSAFPDGCDVVVVDTGPAHSAAQEENSNTEQKHLAKSYRAFASQLTCKLTGQVPLVLVQNHPANGADTRNRSAEPRGGSSLKAEIDGLLGVRKDGDGLLWLYHHSEKWRNKPFNDIAFNLSLVPSDCKDNFGDVVCLPVAHIASIDQTAGLTPTTDVAFIYKLLVEAGVNDEFPPALAPAAVWAVKEDDIPDLLAQSGKWPSISFASIKRKKRRVVNSLVERGLATSKGIWLYSDTTAKELEE